jgi:hypothetical protein
VVVTSRFKVVKLKRRQAFILYDKVKGGFFLKGGIVVIQPARALPDDIGCGDDDKEEKQQRRHEKLDIATILAKVYGIGKGDRFELVESSYQILALTNE